ncbi:hypothetical protein FHG87_007984 [Trinorchestia longiramus]|nr:hypothetical protein FHG87_007984 [Trinorchestia longiramus]
MVVWRVALLIEEETAQDKKEVRTRKAFECPLPLIVVCDTFTITASTTTRSTKTRSTTTRSTTTRSTTTRSTTTTSTTTRSTTTRSTTTRSTITRNTTTRNTIIWNTTTRNTTTRSTTNRNTTTRHTTTRSITTRNTTIRNTTRNTSEFSNGYYPPPDPPPARAIIHVSGARIPKMPLCLPKTLSMTQATDSINLCQQNKFASDHDAISPVITIDWRVFNGNNIRPDDNRGDGKHRVALHVGPARPLSTDSCWRTHLSTKLPAILLTKMLFKILCRTLAVAFICDTLPPYRVTLSSTRS